VQEIVAGLRAELQGYELPSALDTGKKI